MASYTHLAGQPQPEREGRFYAACCKDSWLDTSPDPARVTCPTCLGVIHRQQLEARDPALPKLELVKVPAARSYRYLYEARLGGELVAYVGFAGSHRRTSWRVCEINPVAEHGVGGELVRDPTERWPVELRFKTKEAALMACEGLRAEGRLKTRPEREAEIAEANARWEAREAERKAEIARRRADILLAHDAVLSALARQDLSNAERAGLQEALKLVEEARP